MTPPIGAVIFDLDGTLVDSVTPAATAYASTIRELDGPHVSIHDVVTAWHVGPAPIVLGHFLGRPADVNDLERFYLQFDKAVRSVRPFDGVDQMLDSLRSDGYRLGVYTAATRRAASLTLAAAGLDGRFASVVAGDDVDDPKPAPEGLWLACRRLGVAPTGAAYVGDSDVDVRCAQAAGTLAVLAAWGAHGLPAADSTRLVAGIPTDVPRLIRASEETPCPRPAPVSISNRAVAAKSPPSNEAVVRDQQLQRGDRSPPDRLHLMAETPDGDQFHFDPANYLDMIRGEVPAYDELQDAVAAATVGIHVERALELGVGTGETAWRVLAIHPAAELIGIDESPGMLAAAVGRLAEADLRLGRLEDPLPDESFDLVVSALAVHHLDGAAKADLFARVADRLRPGGRLVLGDVVMPDDPADAVTPIDGVYDKPSTIDDQLRWLGAAGLDARVVWARQDLAVIVAESDS